MKKASKMIYFSTLSGALDQASKSAKEEAGLFVDNEDMFTSFGTGGIRYGHNKKASISLIDCKGKESKKCLQISIYRMNSGFYELTDYVS